jgi:thiol-disulfide isomerase/thioredoxin
MRKAQHLFFLTFLFSSLALNAQGIEFFQGSWEKALARAAAEEKLIFVDAYASWCGPCKAMAANVFPKKEVGDFFNANFINVKLDMEKAESEDFRKKHRAAAFPTLFFINGENDVVHKTVGGKQVATLLEEANLALGKMDDLDALAARWEEGERSSNFVFTYVRAMVRRGEPHLRVANDFLRSQSGPRDEATLRLIHVAATAADSRIFDLMVAEREGITQLLGEEAFTKAVKRAVATTKGKALEYKDEGLLSTAVEKMALVNPGAAKDLELAGALQLAALGNDLKALQKAAKNYTKKVAATPERQLLFYKTIMASRFAEDEKLLPLALEAGAAAALADTKEGYKQLYRMADQLRKNGQKALALKYAKMAMDAIPEGQVNYQRAVQGLINRIEEG